jgi:hypothetical protein
VQTITNQLIDPKYRFDPKSLVFQLRELLIEGSYDSIFLLNRLAWLVYRFRFYSKPLLTLPSPAPKSITDISDAQLLERALCRFIDPEATTISIDEPLVVRAYLNACESKPEHSWLLQQVTGQPDASTIGKWFEFLLLPVLLDHLSQQKFPFPEGTGFWQGTCSVERYDPTEPPACLSTVNEEGISQPEIADFFKDRSHLVAFFPHIRAGPDIVMVLRFTLDDETVLRVPLFIQIKSDDDVGFKKELERLRVENMYRVKPKERGSTPD